MAESKILMTQSIVEIVYTGSGTYQNDVGNTLTLTKNTLRYSAFKIEMFANSISSSNRRVAVIDNWYRKVNASYWLYPTNIGYGLIRIETGSDGMTLSLLSCQENVYVSAITGLA